MQIVKKYSWLNVKNGLLIVGIALAVYVLTMILANWRLATLEQSTRLLIADQESTLAAIAEVTARNGADAVTESIIKDCSVSERGQFDDLLGKLDQGLSLAQLATLERLFGRCGSFYSQRKAVMVARLAREIEVYESYVTLLNSVTGKDLSNAFNVPKWQALVVEEKKQSELFINLVAVQDEIITTLLSGKKASSPEIVDILRKASEVQQTLLVANKQAANIRSELISL